MVVQSAPSGDSDRQSLGRSESPWYLVFAFGAVLLVAVGHSIYDVHEGRPWSATVRGSAVMLLQTVVLTWGYGWLRKRNTRWGVMLVAGALVSVLFGTLVLQLHTGLTMNFAHTFRHGIPLGLAVGGFWALVILIPAIVRDANLRSYAAENIRREAELSQLRSSLQPHFLLNTLHTISALTVDEPLVARRLLSALGELLSDALEPAPEIRPLATDVSWLRRYAEILEVRHSGKLRFEWDIDPETNTVPLPKLLLQPLLENAVKHGALVRADGGVVTVRARFTDGTLELVVEDNGLGISRSKHDGLGLRIVRERVGLAHPGATLDIASSSAGTRATIKLPRPKAGRV